MQQQARIYVPIVGPSYVAKLLQPLPGIKEVRRAFNIVIPTTTSLEDVWHVEFENYEVFGTPTNVAPLSFVMSYDEVNQERVKPADGVKVVTTTYLRRDVPDFVHLESFRTANNGHLVRFFKGQHPTVLENPKIVSGTVVLSASESLDEIIRLLPRTVWGNFVTYELELKP